MIVNDLSMTGRQRTAWMPATNLPALRVTVSVSSAPASIPTDTINAGISSNLPKAATTPRLTPTRRAHRLPLTVTFALGAASFAPTIANAATPTQKEIDDIIGLAKNANDLNIQDSIIIEYYNAHGRELTPVQAKQLASHINFRSRSDELLKDYAGYYSQAGITSSNAISSEVQHVIETATIAPASQMADFYLDANVSTTVPIGDKILYDYFHEHVATLNGAELKALTDAVKTSSIKDIMLAKYATVHALMAPGEDPYTGVMATETSTLVPDEVQTGIPLTMDNMLVVGGTLSFPLLIIGLLCYQRNSNFRTLVQTVSTKLALPFTASRDSYEKLRLKWDARRTEQERTRQIKKSEKERTARRESLLLGIYSLEDLSDDVKRDHFVELIPLVMEIPSLEERRRILHNVVFVGFRDIRSAYYLKPALMALANELRHPVKSHRDDAAFALRLFFTTHGLGVEEKRRLLDDVMRIPASNATSDATHDIATWKQEWENLPALSAEKPDDRARALAAQGLRQT